MAKRSRPDHEQPDDLEHDVRLSKDLKEAALTMGDREVRFLVDQYYRQQERRKAAARQLDELSQRGEPNRVLDWLYFTAEKEEVAFKKSLEEWGRWTPTGQWAMSITGIGPVITAGLAANVDIHQAPTVGHVYSYAGVTPGVIWPSASQAEKIVNEIAPKAEKNKAIEFEVAARAAEAVGRKPERIWDIARRKRDGSYKSKPTKEDVRSAIATRPWNEQLKVLVWKIGESIVKFQNHKNEVYGTPFKERKREEWMANLRGDYARDAYSNRARGVSASTIAYKWYSGMIPAEEGERVYQALAEGKAQPTPRTVKAGDGLPMYPPQHIHNRAARWAAKMFVSHWHAVRHWNAFHQLPPLPYPIEHMGHKDIIRPPNMPTEMKKAWDDRSLKMGLAA